MQEPIKHHPPPILQIAREPLKPGREAAYRNVEEDTARQSAKLGCPHPYLGVESLSGPKEIWWFNGYDSPEEPRQVADAYTRNKAFMAALTRNQRRKASLTEKVVETFARYRADLTTGDPWILGSGRFLVITIGKSWQQRKGTVFEVEDGTFVIISSAQTREEADRIAPNADSRIFAVRPSFSFPAAEWTASDPEFWERNAQRKRQH